MKTVILANAPGTELAPLSDQYCTALLPVTGKPLIEHTAESLALAGVEEAFVVVSPHADRVESLLGMGDKWGMKLEYVLTRGDESTSGILRDLKQKLGDEVLLLYADQIRTPFLSTFMEQSASNHPQTSVMATVNEKPTGALIIQLSDTVPFDLRVLTLAHLPLLLGDFSGLECLLLLPFQHLLTSDFGLLFLHVF